MVRAASLVLVVASFAATVPQNSPVQPLTQAQQRPVFRGGTHFVRVDAYPTSKDGHIVEGLKAEDFEVTEDGKPQAIESFDYISFPTFTPEAERRDPESQRAGFDLAADPRYRVFAIMLDFQYVEMGALSRSPAGADPAAEMRNIQQPVTQFIDRVLGSMDLFAFLTTSNTAKDLVLGQKTTAIQAQIADLWRAALMDRDLDLERFDACLPNADALKGAYRVDRTYTALESLLEQLGSLREERKNVVFIGKHLSRARPNPALLRANGASFPKAGMTQGRVTIGDHGDGRENDTFCVGEAQRLAAIDFDERYRTFLKAAQRENVTFYVLTPEGLTEHRPDDSLISLAHETDGIAITGTNDLSGGMKKIADDLAAYYVLGYYTTNTKWDGAIRTIKVKLKPSGETIRARRQYRAPTEAEIAALANRPSVAGRPTSAVAEKPTLIGEPSSFLVALRQPPQKVSVLEFTRSDRLRVQWPVLGLLDRREARLLDSTGKPLAIEVPLSEDAAANTIAVELPLAPFARGVYSIELTAGAGEKTEQRRVTFTMK